MGAKQEQELDPKKVCLAFMCGVAAIFGLVFFLVGTTKDPMYSVTITGVAGLQDDLAAAANLPLSPVFNLTVRIDNGGNWFADACIGRLSTVTVSYRDAILAGRGSVPQFCAEATKVREGGAMAWRKDVDLPQFLRDQLAGELAAGEAAVDVKVTTPAVYYMDSDTVLVCSQAKIGGGQATCREETVFHDQQANPGFTG